MGTGYNDADEMTGYEDQEDEIANEKTPTDDLLDLIEMSASPKTKLLAKAALRAMERLNEAIAQDSRFGVEPPTGSVVKWVREFPKKEDWLRPNDVSRFTYAALRTGGQWFLTGKQIRPMSWDDLIEKHLRHSVAPVQVVESWRTIGQ